MIFSVCLVLSMGTLLLLLWRYDLLPWYSRHPPPFHLAWRELRRMQLQASEVARVHHGIVLIRHAFDQALGRAASAEALPQLFSALPWLAPLQAEIAGFYRASERILFSGRTDTGNQHVDIGRFAGERAPDPASQIQECLTIAQLRQLSRRLMLLERA